MVWIILRRYFVKKIGIVTLYGLFNFGNRLQNYATQKIFLNLGFEVNSLIREDFIESGSLINNLKTYLLIIIRKGYYQQFKQNKRRKNNFKNFQKLINFTTIKKEDISKLRNKYDYFAVGSDQVWNPCYCEQLDWYFLDFCDNEQKISLAPSIGINVLPNEYNIIFKEKLNSFNYLSCRENEGSKIINELTGREVETVIDPTMMLTVEEWDEIIKKPTFHKEQKYVLLYFLGELGDESIKLLDELNKLDYKIINILDINSEYYVCGPCEFVWLIKNASLMITDSFHGCVFSILYKTPFISFNRKGTLQMNSRLNTLLKKFNFEQRMYSNNLSTDEILNQDFSNVEKVLFKERELFKTFIYKCLYIENQ